MPASRPLLLYRASPAERDDGETVVGWVRRYKEHRDESGRCGGVVFGTSDYLYAVTLAPRRGRSQMSFSSSIQTFGCRYAGAVGYLRYSAIQEEVKMYLGRRIRRN